MSSRVTSWIARTGVLATAGVLVAGFAPNAFAQGGQSTPGVTVTAHNPGRSSAGSSMRIELTAHSAHSKEVVNPSCRPQDLSLRCWGSLILRVPDEGGFSVSGFEVHRIAVGATSCGDDDSDDGGGCEHEMATSANDPDQPVQAQVNGVAFVTDPGSLQAQGISAGTEVQLLMTLTDYGTGTSLYQDTIDVVVNLFQSGPNKPLLFDTGTQTIQQVHIQIEGASSS